MRWLVVPATVGLAMLGGATVAASSADVVNPLAAKWRAAGDAALAAKHPQAAIDAYEAALAVDAKDGGALIGIARAYDAQGLPGHAIRYYREALAVQPNDLDALAGQGVALVARGATTRARVNLDRIKTLCKGDCPAAMRVETALAAPPPVAPTPIPVASADTAKVPVGKP